MASSSMDTSLTGAGKFEVDNLKFGAMGDRVLIEEDEFKSGYECTVCDGAGKVPCESCKGAGSYRRGAVDIKCSQCAGGAVTCPECKGKGGLLVAPETAQRRPTTGTVKSVGPGTKDHLMTLKVGDRVMYSNFAGYVTDFARLGKSVTMRILHETEILCQIEGHLDLRTFKGKTEIAEVTK
jgi:chaperonin GroES